jgi:hypothetical protein
VIQLDESGNVVEPAVVREGSKIVDLLPGAFSLRHILK